MANSQSPVPKEAGKTSFSLIDPAKLESALELTPGQNCLDLGCGRGDYSLLMARLVGPPGRVVGIDLWPEGVAQLNRAARDEGLTNVEGVVADVMAPPPSDWPLFDLALMSTVLHDLNERGQAEPTLNRVARLLRPGGRLAVNEFKVLDGRPGPPKHIRLAPPDVVRLAGPQGLAPIREYDLGPYNYLIMLEKG